MLYLVPTPLGNLEDVTRRALSTLAAVKAVYCEDTRRTRQLLSHFGISVPTLRYDDRDRRGVASALERLRRGDDLALVSDGGTPVLSDPGLRLVAAARAEGLPVSSLPGPSAVAAAVAGSGLPGDSFVFLGFLPRSPGRRRKALEAAAALGRTLVVYESPHRVLTLLDELAAVLGPAAQVAAARELSKLHEEWLIGTPAEVRARLAARERVLGELVVCAHPVRPDEAEQEEPHDPRHHA